ncbi:sensor histidine kinase [Azospirillum agricola]|uniref:sensor histidine kinase n=1 Tax=Azospirillum agricola TaxID=1720247 RepID=UPI000A0F02A0|nr:ATP-binding protein [Azospirillum agricola]SMH54908.1 two-component system, cell cycle sensor histidine kinase PleC [Azospirillum lipoferum]
MTPSDPIGYASAARDDEAAYTAAGLAVPVAPVDSDRVCAEAIDRFSRHADLPALVVVDRDGWVLGLIDRNSLMAAFAEDPEVARRPVAELMDAKPLTVEAGLTLSEIGRRMARLKPAALVTGFVVVRDGRYLGLGTATGLMARSAEQGELRSRQLEAARRQAEQANRAKTAFLANMSHEIRTPLNAMMGFAEILEQEVLGPHAIPLYREYARDIAESGRHLMDLINDLLDLSKAEADRLDLVEATVDVPRVLAGTARLLSERAARNGVRIVTAVPPDLPALWADERKLRQMLLNLLSNAVKFTPADGVVTVSARLAANGSLWMSVHDTGIGMSGEELAKALEPWGQIDSALGRGHVGTGLGLPLTKCLIELHGGRLDVISTPDRGTTMALVFPPDRMGRA